MPFDIYSISSLYKIFEWSAKTVAGLCFVSVSFQIVGWSFNIFQFTYLFKAVHNTWMLIRKGACRVFVKTSQLHTQNVHQDFAITWSLEKCTCHGCYIPSLVFNTVPANLSVPGVAKISTTLTHTVKPKSHRENLWVLCVFGNSRFSSLFLTSIHQDW